jgi:ATP-dependent DNA helicase RecG
MPALENQNTEWKEKWRDDYLQWVCGFANAQGGVLEIGRNDNGVVVGVQDAEKLLEMLPNKIRNATGVLADICIHTEDGKQYISIMVKPYPAPVTYHGRYYYRSGSTTQELTGNALDEFMLRKQGKTWDGVPVPYISENEFHRDAFMFFREKAIASTRLSKEDLEIDDEALLKSLLLTEGKYLKRAAILLFHQNPEMWVPGAFVKIGYFENESEVRYQDEIHGPLISMPDRVLDTLYLKYFKGLISYRGIQRIETYPVARSALRETVLNAVVHKDYSTGNPIQIRVYNDRVSIFNSGGLPEGWTVEKLLSWHESNPRNPMIAGAFYRSGMIETWGRGIERIITACHEEGKPEPLFETSLTGVRVLFTDNAQSSSDVISDANIGDNIGDAIGDNIGDSLNKTQIKIIEMMSENPAVSAKSIAEGIDISPRNVEANIRSLKKMGLIERTGSTKNGRWIVKNVNPRRC